MKKICFLLFTLLTFKAFAQSSSLYFEHLGVAEGLPEAFVEAMLQDKFGYMWLGTQDGLVRYDGYQVKVYKLGEHEKNTPQDFAVTDIFEDKQGTLWVINRVNDLYRYDRYQDSFKQFKLANGSAYGYHSKIIQDAGGGLWVYPLSSFFSAAYCLQRFDPATGRSKSFPYISYAACKSPDGDLWFGTDKGLAHYTSATGKLTVEPLSLTKPGQKFDISGLYEAPSMPGVLWLSVKAPFPGLFSFDLRSKKLTRYTHHSADAGSIMSDTILKIVEDKRHRLWFCTNLGISFFDRDKKSFTNYNYPATFSKGQTGLYNVAEQADGQLWISFLSSRTANNGLLQFDPATGKFRQFLSDKNDPNSLSTSLVARVMIDRSGTVWTGNAWGGADRVNSLRSGFHLYKSTPGATTSYPAGGAFGIVQTADSYCWMGSDEGLIRWKPDGDVFERIKLPSTVSAGRIRLLGADREGLLWCSNTPGTKLFSYDVKTTRVGLYHLEGMRITYVTRVFQDRSGLLWIGADSGLYSYRKSSGIFTAYPYEKNQPMGRFYTGKKLDDSYVETINQDRSGTIWIGTNLGGLNRYDPKTNTFRSYYDIYNGLNCVDDIYEAEDGRFWVGTYLRGLFLFDRGSGGSIRFTEENGLLHNSIHGLKEDDKGALWLVSNRGLTRFDPNKKTFSVFTTGNALPVKTTEVHNQDVLKTANNELLIGTRDGLIAFYPDKLSRNPFPPLVYIESVAHNDPQAAKDSVSQQIILDKKKIELPYYQNRVTFNYVALHYEDPAQNKYAYRLSGYDKNWVQAGTQRSVTYTNLSPGTYTFSVKAANSDGVWNAKGTSMLLVIYPPWWDTWWVWVLYIIIFGVALYALIQYRSRKLLHDNRILEHKVHVRTEEVLQQKEEIEAQRDELEITLKELKTTQTQLIQSEKMASLGELTAGIAHEIQNPLNFVNNFSEVNTELIGEMKQEIDKGDLEEVKAIASDIEENSKKINLHGKRADFIVKGMLQHSRSSTGEREPTNINVLADEFFKLSYHGLRAKDKSFNAEMITHFDRDLSKINVVQQDIGRVLLNLFNNAFYAVNQKQKTAGADYKPEVSVTTAAENGNIIIKVKDNGNGIPNAIKDKIMQPFFTTKPTGEGTGLGLSLSYDIVVKGHGGNITVDTQDGGFTEFTVTLPVN
jgi:signal transduction histidine kinase/ligand-binding sensor domain-containing protein